MTIRRRTPRKTNIHLESLESREAPDVGIAAAWQTAFNRLHALESRAIRSLEAQRTSPVSLGGESSQAARNALLALAQARRAALHATPPAAAVLQAPWALRSPLRRPPEPVTPPSSNPPATPIMTPPESPTDAGTSSPATPPQDLPPNVSGVLNVIYQNFTKGSSTMPVITGPGSVQIDGSNVGVYVNGNGQGDFAGFLSTLENLGMKINATSDVTWTVSGMLPISQLLAAAQTPQTLSITPLFSPITF
jgi:hypothetical protein